MLLLKRRLWKFIHWCSNDYAFCYNQRASYVDVQMKWKKDPFYDSLDTVIKTKELRPLISLKNIIVSSPDGSIPISDVSKQDRILEISGRVASFLRKYPAVFEEFTGPKFNLPWFKLTEEAMELDRREREVYEAHRPEIVDRLRRLILMSSERRLPLRIVQGMLWYLGLPENFLKNSEEVSNGYFQIVDMGNEELGLATFPNLTETPLSVLQKDSIKKYGCIDLPPSVIAFPLFPSKGLRLKRKIEQWLEDFQKLPYVSPYEDFSNLNPCSDISEKRVAGVLHELLSLFVDHSAERRKLLCLKKYLGLPQKFHKVFERHPHVFYLLLKSKTCFVVLKEAYCAGSATAIERHPLFDIRKKYIRLMNKSETILIRRRSRRPVEDSAEATQATVLDSKVKINSDESCEGIGEISVK